MKVRELIEKLKLLDPELRVVSPNGDDDLLWELGEVNVNRRDYFQLTGNKLAMKPIDNELVVIIE